MWALFSLKSHFLRCFVFVRVTKQVKARAPPLSPLSFTTTPAQKHKPSFNLSSTLNQNYASTLQQRCPVSGGDQNLFYLDYETPTKFDNYYFKNLVNFRGLLNSDEILFTQSSETMEMVKVYAENEEAFFEQFAKSIVKMGNISPLTGMDGEIRKVCRRVNHDV